MSSAADQFLSFIGTNGGQASGSCGIARTGGSDLLRAESLEAPCVAVVDDGLEGERPPRTDATGFAHLDRIRVATAARTQAALLEWRDSWFAIMSAATASSDMSGFVRTAEQPPTAAESAAPEAAKVSKTPAVS